MTSPTTAAPDPRTLVAEVLGEVAAAGKGDPTAEAGLSARARHGVPAAPRVFTAVQPATVAPPPPGVALPAGSRMITRPNGQVYHVRKLGNHEDVAVLRKLRVDELPPLFYGPPGNGKTALFEAAFADVGFEFVPGDGDTGVPDFVGAWQPTGDPDNPYVWVDGPLPVAMEAGIPLLIDEIALIDPKVLAVVYSVMDGRGVLKINANPSRGLIHAKTGFFVVGACNPNAPGARMSEALLSRFAVHVEMMPDYQLMRRMGVDVKIVTIAENLKRKYDSSAVNWFPGMRELLGFKRVADSLGHDTAVSNLISQAPEADRQIVASVITQGLSKTYTGLVIK